MAETAKFITNNVFYIMKILELMKQPKGTTIEEIRRELYINRRSVFRLLKVIEQKLCKPFTVHRSSFGGTASYHLSPAFIEKLSGICLPELSLTFNQAVFVYLVVMDDQFTCENNGPDEIDQLRKLLEPLYDQQ